MDDSISRQAAIDAIHYYCKNICGLSDYNWCPDCPSERFVGLLKELPSVQPAQKWIPVSERLPEENEEVLVTFKSDDEIRVYNCKYFDNSPWWRNYVIAWMPLPEPYKAESEDE